MFCLREMIPNVRDVLTCHMMNDKKTETILNFHVTIPAIRSQLSSELRKSVRRCFPLAERCLALLWGTWLMSLLLKARLPFMIYLALFHC